MNTMFKNCKTLTSLDLSSFDTSKVTTMKAMFNNCVALATLDVSSFNTSKVTTMKEMFNSCGDLTSLNLSGFDTGNVTDMNNMFCDCHVLAAPDFSHFNTSKVTTMEGMFGRCYAFDTLDVSSFTNESLTNIDNMFFQCTSLTTIYAKAGANWTTNLTAEKGGSGVFHECSNLVGGSGSKMDDTNGGYGYWGMYAKIDGGTSSPGYFTPVTYIGTKVPTEAKAVGDIVFSDGSATPYTSNLTLTDTQKSAAVAVIFYVGTVCAITTPTQ